MNGRHTDRQTARNRVDGAHEIYLVQDEHLCIVSYWRSYPARWPPYTCSSTIFITLFHNRPARLKGVIHASCLPPCSGLPSREPVVRVERPQPLGGAEP